MNNFTSCPVLFQVFYRVLSGNLDPAQIWFYLQQIFRNLGINIVKSKRSVRQGYEFKIMVVIFQLDVVFFHHLSDSCKLFQCACISRRIGSVFLWKIRNCNIFHANFFVGIRNLLRILHHLNKRNMCRNRNQTYLIQYLLNIFRLQTI